MRYPAGTKKGRRVRIKTPAKPVFGRAGSSIGATGQAVAQAISPTQPSPVSSDAASGGPMQTVPASVEAAASAAATAASKKKAAGGTTTTSSSDPFASGDPWEIAKKIVDDDIAAQTAVIQKQKDAATARNQAILNTFFGFQAALSKLSGTLGPQYDAAMKDLGNSQAAFSQGFKDAQGHIQGGGDVSNLISTARATNPFYSLPGNLGGQAQLIGMAQAKQLNDQLSQYDLQIQGLSGNRMKDLFSIYTDVQNSRLATQTALQKQADDYTNMTGYLYTVDKSGNIVQARGKKGAAIPVPGSRGYANLTARQKVEADSARQASKDSQDRYFKFWSVAKNMTDETGVLWLPTADGTGITMAKQNGQPVTAPGSSAAHNAAMGSQYNQSQLNATGKQTAANMTKADPNHVYTYNPSTGTISSIPRTYRPPANAANTPASRAKNQGILGGKIKTDVKGAPIVTTTTDPFKGTTQKKMPYNQARVLLVNRYLKQWTQAGGNRASLLRIINRELAAIGIKPISGVYPP